MNKKQLIDLLEGRRVQTADKTWYLVEDGKFVTKDGATCRLKDYTKFQLMAFWNSSRANLPIEKCNHAPFSQDLEYQHNAYFRDYYKCRMCGAEVFWPEHRFGGYVGFP